jgi:hypothetical protein
MLAVLAAPAGGQSTIRLGPANTFNSFAEYPTAGGTKKLIGSVRDEVGSGTVLNGSAPRSWARPLELRNQRPEVVARKTVQLSNVMRYIQQKRFFGACLADL